MESKTTKMCTFLTNGKETQIEVSFKFVSEFEALEDKLQPMIENNFTVNLTGITCVNKESKFVNFVENDMRKIVDEDDQTIEEISQNYGKLFFAVEILKKCEDLEDVTDKLK